MDYLLFYDNKLNDNISQEVGLKKIPYINLKGRAEKDLKKFFDRGWDFGNKIVFIVMNNVIHNTKILVCTQSLVVTWILNNIDYDLTIFKFGLCYIGRVHASVLSSRIHCEKTHRIINLTWKEAKKSCVSLLTLS